MTIYSELLGNGWKNVPEPIRRLHEAGGEGSFRVERKGFVRFLPLLPPAGEKVSIHLRIVATEKGEQWIRTFDGVHVYKSVQRTTRGTIKERIGVLTVTMTLSTTSDALRYHLVEARVLGMKIPFGWLPRTVASELAEGPFVRVVVRIGDSFGYSGLVHPR